MEIIMSTQQLTFNAIEEPKTSDVISSWSLARVAFVISLVAGYAFLAVCYLGMARLISIY
jgi:hypothetical protein